MAGKPASLEDLFKNKAKKKPKGVNLSKEQSKEKPPEAPKPVLARELIAEGVLDPEEGWKRALKHDQDLLEACSLKIKEVEADGACLFRAFGDQLDGDGGSKHADYREQCIDFMKAHRSDFEPFIEEDFDGYCRRMSEATSWGGQVEVQALARSLGVNALIYRPAEATVPTDLEKNTIEVLSEGSQRCVQLVFHPQHHAGPHYNSVRCLGNDDGPALEASAEELRRRVQEALTKKEAPPAEAEEEEAPKNKGNKLGMFG